MATVLLPNRKPVRPEELSLKSDITFLTATNCNRVINTGIESRSRGPYAWSIAYSASCERAVHWERTEESAHHVASAQSNNLLSRVQRPASSWNISSYKLCYLWESFQWIAIVPPIIAVKRISRKFITI